MKKLAFFLSLSILCAAAQAKPNSLALLMKQGDALVMIGSYDKAAQAYRAVLKRKASDSMARVRLALCLWRMGQGDEAMALLENTSMASTPVEALQIKADIYLERKDYLKATGVLEKLLQRSPGNIKLKMQLGDCYREMSKLGNPEARARALKLYAEVERAARDEQLKRRAMEAGLTMRYGEMGENLLRAKEMIAQGKTVAALKLLKALSRQHKDKAPPFLHYLRAMALLSPSVDDRSKAMAALVLARGYPEAALQLGIMHYEDGALDKAKNQLALAIKSNPNDQRAHYHLGLVHREEGADEKAIKAWRKTISLDSSSSLAQWAKTKMQVLTGRVRSLAPGQVIDPATEIQIGKKTCELIEKRWPVLRNERLHQRLTRIMDRLLQHSDRPKRDLRYKIAIINVPIPNALTVPNGKIYFFTGLVDLIRTRMGDTDDAYASVLAHEISHNVLRHGVGMIKVASTQKRYNSFLHLSKLMGALSRTHEFEADQYGALYAYRAGYDPSAGIQLHQKMLQKRGEIPRGMSHPQHGERIARLRDYLLELRAKVRHFKKGVSAIKEKAYDKAVDHLELFLGVFPDSAAARNNLALALHRKALLNTKAAPVYRRSTDIDPKARIRTIRLRSTAEERRRRRIDKRLLKEAVGEYAMVLRKHSRYATARNNIATALSDLGELKLAKKHLQIATEVKPSYKQAHNNLGVVLAQLKDYRKAVGSLQRAIALDSRYAAAHFNLALVFEKLKNRKKAIEHWERYVALDSSSGWATIARTRRAALN